MNQRLLIITGTVLSLGLSFPCLADTFHPPVLEKKAFSIKELKINKIPRASLLRGLLSTARDFDHEHGANYTLRAHALSMASHLKPGSEKITDVLTQLKNRGSAAPEDNASTANAVRSIYRGVTALMKKKGVPCQLGLRSTLYRHRTPPG